jgi:hypothetical protein
MHMRVHASEKNSRENEKENERKDKIHVSEDRKNQSTDLIK